MSETTPVAAESWLDSFVSYVKEALEIVQLKAEAIDRARDDDDAFTMAIVVIVLGGIGAAIGSLAPFGVVAFPVFYLIMAFLLAGVFHLLATVAFKGEGEFVDFFRPYGLAFVLSWINVVWVLNVILGWIAGLWMFVVWAYCVERVYGIDRARAIATVAIPVAVMFFLMVIFGAFLVSMALILGLASAG